MFGFWYFTIGCGIIFVIGIVLLVIDRVFQGWKFLLGLLSALVDGVLFLAFLSISILVPMKARKEYNQFLEQQIVIEELIESGTDYDNISVTQSLISANEWLVGAKASKKTYGCFSAYFYIDLEALKPIEKKEKR